jgi:hypothetical protein
VTDRPCRFSCRTSAGWPDRLWSLTMSLYLPLSFTEFKWLWEGFKLYVLESIWFSIGNRWHYHLQELTKTPPPPKKKNCFIKQHCREHHKPSRQATSKGNKANVLQGSRVRSGVGGSLTGFLETSRKGSHLWQAKGPMEKHRDQRRRWDGELSSGWKSQVEMASHRFDAVEKLNG